MRRQHVLEAMKALAFLWSLQLAGRYLHCAYHLLLVPIPEVVVEEPPPPAAAAAAEEVVKVEKKRVEKIVKIPVVEKVTEEVLATELTPNEQGHIRQLVQNKIQQHKEDQRRKKRKRSELLTVASTSQAVQRQLVEMDQQAKTQLQQLNDHIQPLLLPSSSNNNNNAVVDFQKMKEIHIENWKQLLQINPLEPGNEDTVQTTLNIAMEELRTLSVLIVNSKLNLPTLYQLFNTTKDLQRRPAQLCTMKDDDVSAPPPPLNEQQQQPEKQLTYHPTASSSLEEEKEDEFAKQSDFLALSKVLEDRLRRRDVFLEDYGNDNSLQFLMEDTLESLKHRVVQLAETHQAKRKEKWMKRLEMQQGKRVQQMERRLEQTLNRIEHKKVQQEKSSNNDDICVQSHDIVQLVQEASLALPSTLEKVLTNTLRNQMEQFLEDYNELESYQITSSSSIMENDPIMQPQKHSSSLMHQENLRSLVDTALLPKISEWLDTFVETIAGYNDSVDDIIDLLAGDERNGESVGKRLEHVILTSMEHIQVPKLVQQKILQAGILTNL